MSSPSSRKVYVWRALGRVEALHRWLAGSVVGGWCGNERSQGEIPENTTDIQHIMDPFTLDLVNFFKRKHCFVGKRGGSCGDVWGDFWMIEMGHYSGWVAT